MAITPRQKLLSPDKYSLKCPYSMEAEFLVVHNTANDASANNEITYMIGNTSSTSFHYAVDDIEVVQGVPTNRNAYHAGDGVDGPGNRKGIAVEICYSKSGGPKFSAAEELAAQFLAQELKARGWGLDRIRKHQDFAAKYCPHRTLDLGWQRFLNMIQNELDALNPAPAPSVLSQGSTGDAVKLLQGKLIKLNYLPAGSDDGSFGPITKAAVVKFQSENGLAADGVVGPLTQAKLDEKIAALSKVLYRVILDGKQVEALSDQQNAINEVKNAVDTGAAKEGKVQRNTDGVDVFVYTKPVVTTNVLYRIILDGKQVAAISDRQKAIDTVKASVDNGQAISGKVQQTDGVDIFFYTKPVPEPAPAPAPVPEVQVQIEKHPLLGESQCTVEQMAQFLLSNNSEPKIKCTAYELALIFLTEGKAEGIRGDIAFAQSIHETGFFNFGGDVKPEQNNYAGIGTVGGGVAGATFPDPATGVRAQIQHLKAYASAEALNNACVDPRYNLVSKGCAPNLEDLSGKWAVPGYDKNKYTSLNDALKDGATYGQGIFKLTEAIRRTEVPAPQPIPVPVPPAPDPEPAPVVVPEPVPAPVEPVEPKKDWISVLLDLIIAFIKSLFKKGE